MNAGVSFPLLNYLVIPNAQQILCMVDIRFSYFNFYILANLSLGLHSSIWPICRALVENPLASEAEQKNDILVSVIFVAEFTL
jgi:hypothetical protein